jgi:hypothetical protein
VDACHCAAAAFGILSIQKLLIVSKAIVLTKADESCQRGQSIRFFAKPVSISFGCIANKAIPAARIPPDGVRFRNTAKAIRLLNLRSPTLTPQLPPNTF